MTNYRPAPPAAELIFAVDLSPAQARAAQRQVAKDSLVRICKGVYAPKLADDELAVLVRRHWQRVAGMLAPAIGTSGLYHASRQRLLLENIGRQGDLRAPKEDVESLLVSVLNASGEKALA